MNDIVVYCYKCKKKKPTHIHTPFLLFWIKPNGICWFCMGIYGDVEHGRDDVCTQQGVIILFSMMVCFLFMAYGYLFFFSMRISLF